jgi:hypothetical protein
MMPMFLIMGLLLAGLSIPLILGIIPPNGLYGFRIRKTIENPEIWYPVNKRAGMWLLVLGICVILAAAGFALIPNITIDAYSLSILGVVMVVFALTLVDTIRYMNAL